MVEDRIVELIRVEDVSLVDAVVSVTLEVATWPFTIIVMVISYEANVPATG